MANTNRPVGFKPKNIKDASVTWYPVTAAQVIVAGDMVSMDSAGSLVIGDGSPIVGVAATNMIDPDTGFVKTTAEAGDKIGVWDNPNEVFIAQSSEYAAADPYTTRSSAACFDVAGTTGVQYIDSATHANDAIKIVRLAAEEDGKESIAGVYAKVECRINNLKHLYGVIA